MEENDNLSSEMYRNLVVGRQDLLGIIAYTLYKQDKNKAISNDWRISDAQRIEVQIGLQIKN